LTVCSNFFSGENYLSQQLGQGLVSIFTGDGKGKTTAAIGTVVRAAGHGLKTFIVFFMKGESFVHGEVNVLSQMPDVTLASFGQNSWVDRDNVKPEDKEQARLAFAAAREAMLSGKYDLVVLDEINIAIDYGLIELDEVIKLVNDKPKNVELILTGRNIDAKLVKMADLVTEMLMIKHPYTRGIRARRGIDY
jgi:cob(I)alamin adenosyltransferase